MKDNKPLCTSLHLTPAQQKRFAKVIEDYHLDERDVRHPIAKRFTHKEICAIVERCSGLTHDILLLLDAKLDEWRAYLSKHPDVATIQEQAREAIVDKAEQKVMSALESDNDVLAEKTAEFVLKTLGKKRGWDTSPSSAQQITVSKDGEVNIKQIFGIEDK